MRQDLQDLWRRRQNVARRIERATRRVSPSAACEYDALTTAIAKDPIRSDGGADVKFALLRELAAHAPDAELLLQLIDTIGDWIHTKESMDLPPIPAGINGMKKANKGFFPL